MRVCIEIASGTLIEAQSAATPGTLIQNAVNAGYDADAVEERVVTQEELDALIAQQNTQPAKDWFLSRDLVALLTEADYSAVQSAIVSSPALGLLWTAMIAQGNAPISFSSNRTQAGWDALGSVLGTNRTAELKTGLGIA